MYPYEPTFVRWRDVPVPNPREWARQRGDHWVTFQAERTEPQVIDGAIVFLTTGYTSETPACLYDTMRFADGWRYTELTREPA